MGWGEALGKGLETTLMVLAILAFIGLVGFLFVAAILSLVVAPIEAKLIVGAFFLVWAGFTLMHKKHW